MKPGNPPYLKYVRSTVEEKQNALKEDSALQNGSGEKSGETLVRGNPNLIYSSQFLEGWEPSGVPVRLVPIVTPKGAAKYGFTSHRMRWKSPVALESQTTSKQISQYTPPWQFQMSPGIQ